MVSVGESKQIWLVKSGIKGALIGSKVGLCLVCIRNCFYRFYHRSEKFFYGVLHWLNFLRLQSMNCLANSRRCFHWTTLHPFFLFLDYLEMHSTADTPKGASPLMLTNIIAKNPNLLTRLLRLSIVRDPKGKV